MLLSLLWMLLANNLFCFLLNFYVFVVLGKNQINFVHFFKRVYVCGCCCSLIVSVFRCFIVLLAFYSHVYIFAVAAVVAVVVVKILAVGLFNGKKRPQ